MTQDHGRSLVIALDVAKVKSKATKVAWAVVQSAAIADLYTAMPCDIVPSGRRVVARYSKGRKMRGTP